MWQGWKLTDQGLIDPDGFVYQPSDIRKERFSQADLAKLLGVTRPAITDRLRRGTLIPDGYNDSGKPYWLPTTVVKIKEGKQ